MIQTHYLVEQIKCLLNNIKILPNHIISQCIFKFGKKNSALILSPLHVIKILWRVEDYAKGYLMHNEHV